MNRTERMLSLMANGTHGVREAIEASERTVPTDLQYRDVSEAYADPYVRGFFGGEE